VWPPPTSNGVRGANSLKITDAIRAEVKSIEARDAPLAATLGPTGAGDEYRWFTATVGTTESRAGDLFQVCVATARGIKARRTRGKFVGLVVPTFDAATVEKAIREYVASAEGASWEALAAELGKLMWWEYDGYRE
jgi:hypothetical protein